MKTCNHKKYRYSKLCKACYVKIFRKNSLKSGKYTITKCINCKKEVNRKSRSHLCRVCWIKKNKDNYKFKCKICKKIISFGAKLCKFHFIKSNVIFHKGKNNRNWLGGKTLITRLISGLKRYKIWRIDCFRRDNYTCQMCNKNKTYLEVHHKIPISYIIVLYNLKNITSVLKCKLLWDINWGITLCKNCHNKVHPEKGYKH